MKFFSSTALSLLLLLAGALARSPPAPLRTESDDSAPPVPHGKRVNLTEVLTDTVDGPFHMFVKYLMQADLVAVFENQAYRTDQGITIFAPVDMAFAAVEPSALAGLSRHQLKHLVMYHSLAKHYALGEFEGLSQSNPVTTLAGGRYTVNVTYDGGVIHVKSRWANAKVVGSVYETAPMAVYEVDKVLLPYALFRAHPPVEDIPPVPALPAPGAEEDPPPEDDSEFVPASGAFAPPPPRTDGHNHADHGHDHDHDHSASRAAARGPTSHVAAIAAAMALAVL
ncbi:hypothetical protein GUJ93_ZPchr0014g47143 [Zizania palustris]|uniref:FAS1 domain-containing protein n=1 Tax=Zizania palustris TaxID=103762 RepID=A0A8J5W5R2_ZIZPA|nr:hypothetical protein GUJ93_ZPchr0014g47143 [Zizania palustris]